MSEWIDQPLFEFEELGVHPAEAAYYASIAAHQTWHTAANEAMKHLVRRGEPFSADDLHELLADAGDPPSNGAVGGLFMSWSRQGLIRRVGGGASRKARRNGSHRYEWVGIQADAANSKASRLSWSIMSPESSSQ